MDLAAYLHRIGMTHIPRVSTEDLAKVQRAHRLSIPFENLDVLLGRGISVEDDAIFDKLVTQKRGGYCFEHNALLCWALRTIGFDVQPLLARVWLFATETPPKTHTLNLVTINGDEWIADAGFGSSYCPPMPLHEGACVKGADGAEHRLVIDPNHGWMMQIKLAGQSAFKNEFSFTLERVADLDLAMSNHWTATSPQSRFLKSVIVNIAVPNGMIHLNNEVLKITTSDQSEEHSLTDDVELQQALHDHFGIEMSMDDVKALHAFK